MSIFKKGSFWVLLVLLVAAMAGWRFFGPTGSDINVPTASVEEGNLELQLTEVGELKAARSATITAPNDKLIIFLAPEGSWVKKGDLLVQLESEKYKISVQEFESSLKIAQAQLAKAKSDRQAQVYREEAAEKAYEALLGLKDKGFAMEPSLKSRPRRVGRAASPSSL